MRKQRPTATPQPPSAGQLVYLSLSQLKTHPANMRRAYPIDDVRQMAESIRGAGGVIHALIVVPNGRQPGTYHVVDGNMRLAGATVQPEAIELPLFAQVPG